MEFDKNLWALIKNGDEQAYEEMYFFYYKRFYYYGLKITPNLHLVEDAIQEIMIYIWRNRASLSSVKYPATYFYTSFRNLLVKKLEEQGTILADEFLKEEISESSENSIIKKEREIDINARLKKATSFLTSRQKEAIFLRFYEGFSYEKVAEIMGITVKATYKIMVRALSELKNKYVQLILALSNLPFYFFN